MPDGIAADPAVGALELASGRPVFLAVNALGAIESLSEIRKPMRGPQSAIEDEMRFDDSLPSSGHPEKLARGENAFLRLAG